MLNTDREVRLIPSAVELVIDMRPGARIEDRYRYLLVESVPPTQPYEQAVFPVRLGRTLTSMRRASRSTPMNCQVAYDIDALLTLWISTTVDHRGLLSGTVVERKPPPQAHTTAYASHTGQKAVRAPSSAGL